MESDYSAALRDTFEKFQSSLTHIGTQISDLKKSRTKMAGKIQDLDDICETAVKRVEYNQQMESIQNWTREIVRKEIGDLQSNVSTNSDKITKANNELRETIESMKINTLHRITECESILKSCVRK